MTKAEQREAAAQIDRGGVDAPAWYRERLVGAMLALDPGALLVARPGAKPARREWRG